MKIQLLYILDCPWCVKTKKLIRESLKELGIKADIEEILIDSDEKAKKYNFVGSPTVKINGKDMQKDVSKEQCLPCEELAESTKKQLNLSNKNVDVDAESIFIKVNSILIHQKK